jgi:hypothetical protein
MFVGKPYRALAALVLSGALVAGVSACGSSSGSGSTNASSAGAGGTSTTSSSARYEARLNYAKCMRSHGVNVPDPSANGGAAAGANGAGAGAGGFRALRSNPNFASANTACAKYRSQAFAFGNASPAQRAQLQQDLVKFAECMRAHNINIPDPTTGGGPGGAFGIFRSIPSSERNSPAFASATKACSSDIPFRRGGGGGGPGAGGPPGA